MLDRLRDDAPQRQTEAPEEYAVTRSQMRDILQRDLAFLLNTTSIEDQIDRVRYPEASASTINFGVPPLSGAWLASRKWADIEQMIRRAIREFEPRLIPDARCVAARQGRCREHLQRFDVRSTRDDSHGPVPLEFLVQSSLDLETSRMNVASVHVS